MGTTIEPSECLYRLPLMTRATFPIFYQETLHYGDYAFGSAHLPPYRMNIDPNPNDMYSASEPPLRHASTQRVTAPTDAYQWGNRSTKEQENLMLSLRAVRGSRQDSHAILADTQKRNGAREKLKRRRGGSDMRSETDEERNKSERRKVQKPAR